MGSTSTSDLQIHAESPGKSNRMGTPRRLAVNTAVTYIRSVLAVGLALFSGRWVLSALGASDYGLFSVVGSIIIFITFLNGVMGTSASRYFAFAIGRGETAEANKWFNTALGIHLLLPSVLTLIGLPVGEYCIRDLLIIPPERVTACIWVFRMSMVVAFVNMSAIPYMAMFNAKQHLSEIAAWGMLLSIYNFVLAYVITKLTGDRLLVYVGLGMLGQLLFVSIQIARACTLFPECRCHLECWIDRKRFAELFSFAAWNLFGTFGVILRTQGSSILINQFFGTKVNAAFGIASTVSVQAATLSSSLRGALEPEIIASEGRGEREHVIKLALMACKFSTFLIMLFAIPLLMEMDYVLRLWLRTPPPYTATLCCLMLGCLLVEAITIGHSIAINASGKIASFSVVLGLVHAMTLPLAWMFLKMGYPPEAVGFAALVSNGVLTGCRLLFARNLIGMPVWRWVYDVLVPCVAIGGVASIATLTCRILMLPSFSRLLLTSGTAFVFLVIMGWSLGLRKQEKDFLIWKVTCGIGRLCR